jgi:hypothetical protein
LEGKHGEDKGGKGEMAVEMERAAYVRNIDSSISGSRDVVTKI